MSHINQFETVVSDQDALVKALLRMGVPKNLIEVHETPMRLNTYHQEERAYAHVVVRRKLSGGFQGYSSDIGWERTPEGLFVAHIDEYDYSCGLLASASWQRKLYSYCNIEASKNALVKQGLEYTETTLKDGRVQLRAKFKDVEKKEQPRIKTHSK